MLFRSRLHLKGKESHSWSTRHSDKRLRCLSEIVLRDLQGVWLVWVAEERVGGERRTHVCKLEKQEWIEPTEEFVLADRVRAQQARRASGLH